MEFAKSSCLLWIALAVAGCSSDSDEERIGGEVRAPLREQTDILCPVHDFPVFKIEASIANLCYAWDPKVGLTIDQIRNRFPYAVWDGNLHRSDDSSDATIPEYNLVCERCQASWREYSFANSPPDRDSNLKISILASGEILIDGTEFAIEQIPAIARTVSKYQTEPRVSLRADEETSTDLIKSVVEACKKGGLTDFIFGSYVEKRDGKLNVPLEKSRQEIY